MKKIAAITMLLMFQGCGKSQNTSESETATLTTTPPQIDSEFLASLSDCQPAPSEKGEFNPNATHMCQDAHGGFEYISTKQFEEWIACFSKNPNTGEKNCNASNVNDFIKAGQD